MLVLDEPTTGVDPVSRREFWKLLAEFLAQGLTIVMATPYLDEAERCARVALLERRPAARARRAGASAGRDERRRFSKSSPTPARQRAADVCARVSGAERVQLFGDRLHVRVDARRRGRRACWPSSSARASRAASVRAIVPTLEDVFIERLALARAAGPSPAQPAAGSRVDRRKAAHARTLTSLMVLTLVMTPGVAAAQTALSLTLDEAIRMGVAHAPRLAEARARDAAAADGVASNAALETADRHGVGRLPADEPRRRVRVRPAGGTFDVIFPDIPNNYRVRAEMDMPIYTAGRVDALVAAARGRRSARARPIGAPASQDVRLDVTRAYWALVDRARERRACSSRRSSATDA